MPNILGVDVNKKAVLLSQVHNAVEIIGMTLWLQQVLAGRPITGFAILAGTLTIEHVLALAAGKIA